VIIQLSKVVVLSLKPSYVTTARAFDKGVLKKGISVSWLRRGTSGRCAALIRSYVTTDVTLSGLRTHDELFGMENMELGSDSLFGPRTSSYGHVGLRRPSISPQRYCPSPNSWTWSCGLGLQYDGRDRQEFYAVTRLAYGSQGSTSVPNAYGGDSTIDGCHVFVRSCSYGTGFFISDVIQAQLSSAPSIDIPHFRCRNSSLWGDQLGLG